MKKPKRSELGAGEGVRTLDLNLGKVALYQLSYSRKSLASLYTNTIACKDYLLFQIWEKTPRLELYPLKWKLKEFIEKVATQCRYHIIKSCTSE